MLTAERAHPHRPTATRLRLRAKAPPPRLPRPWPWPRRLRKLRSCSRCRSGSGPTSPRTRRNSGRRLPRHHRTLRPPQPRARGKASRSSTRATPGSSASMAMSASTVSWARRAQCATSDRHGASTRCPALCDRILQQPWRTSPSRDPCEPPPARYHGWDAPCRAPRFTGVILPFASDDVVIIAAYHGCFAPTSSPLAPIGLIQFNPHLPACAPPGRPACRPSLPIPAHALAIEMCPTPISITHSYLCCNHYISKSLLNLH